MIIPFAEKICGVKAMKRSASPVYLCEAEVTPGLEFVTEAELRDFGAREIETRLGEIDFRFSGDLRTLLRLKTVQSVSLVQPFAVPRPRALLGNTQLPLILSQIQAVRRLSEDYHSFYIAAAGSESAVMQRIRSAIAEQTGLTPGADKGDLWIRIRPSRGGQGWETVVRLSPRPLVTRAWRVCNLEGALNAATAQAMIRLTHPQPTDVFVNLGCGSGTLLIERLEYGRCRLAVGVDHQAATLRCAQANLEASRVKGARLLWADMTVLPMHTASVDALCADLPFGQLSGSHQENQRLYPVMLAEAGRIARPGARFALITHEIRLMDSLLLQHPLWSVEQSLSVNLRGLHPHIYVLVRSTSHIN